MDTTKTRPASLVYFAVFNPTFGQTEKTSADQICFFHPASTSLNEKSRQVGLAQALVQFTRTFSPSHPCETVHTRKHRVILYEPEPGYWMLLKVRLGTRTRSARLSKIEYLDSELQDSILKRVLERSYEFFKFLYKGFDHVAQTQSIIILKKTLEEFFTSYIPRIDVASLDLVNALCGIHFASLDKSSYLQISSFIHDLQSQFPILRHVCFLWHDQLVWSGLESFQDLKSVYDFLTDPETGRVYDPIVNQVKRKGEPVIATRRMGLRAPRQPKMALGRKGQRFSGYLVGPTNPSMAGVNVEMRSVYIGHHAVEHFLVVYQFEEECTLVFLIPPSSTVDVNPTDKKPPETDIRNGEFYVHLAGFLDDRLRSLSGVLSEGWTNARHLGEFADQHFRYLYYNSMNLAFKTSIGAYKSTILTPDLITCVDRMHDDFMSSHAGHPNELCIKTASDAWVIGRRSEDRELFMVFPKSDATLVDIDDEVKRFTMAYFSDVLQ
ncbi:uncharacterized protein SPPG_00339 [Spizellomyces punctatus DAOM BR117]|uniref:CCZ1/INTU/HSP4 first Longin domain-containing protein n=1 Tax=Spizellomyces punctatus (strain DAOM BR117) TaxID=645134 RepID=A0A0L0HTG1_SPIPD|nr:uncharacterized protein SPPG_00339 [Spizellomyces punctatus DAOM BR117]KND04621.1 hypothetical protein SPPG_00339 [Spizellomyces punctatus DAOM BR117]|eukprot:XP_016612660.1 hypothetical protein SPPG_00339 [Spizellomyces punctatus DAOM BR117]